MRGRSGTLAALLGISALLSHTGVRKESGSAPTKSETASVAGSIGETGASDWDLLKNFDDFYGLGVTPPQETGPAKLLFTDSDGTTITATASKTPAPKILDGSAWRKRLKDRFDWMIATVPDPDLSGMRLSFDREVNSIQNAVESGGYHFDRYFFPWHLPNQELHGAESTVAETKAKIEARHNLPGMLLFRRDANTPPWDFVVFLVGETPTSGIVRKQFENAVRFGNLSVKEDPISIAGPGFSGSLESLHRITNRRLNLRTWTSDKNLQTEYAKSTRNIVKAVNDSTSYQISHFVRYLRKKWSEKGPIVLLVEESTAFGAGVGPVTDYTDLEPIYIAKFPRGIAKLRNAAEGKEVFGSPEALKGAELIHRGLPFTLKEERIGSSEMPQFSSEQSPVSQESVLLGISSLIKKSALHYAGIVATDPLDLLFLTRFLRSASPNTRLFTFSSDALYQHGSDAAEFQGLLTVTNNPLIPFNQLWTRSTPQNTMLLFAAGDAECAYNAVVDLLPISNDKKAFREYSDPFAEADGSGKRLDFDFQRDGTPALWMTVAGSNGYAPVAPLSEEGGQRTLIALPANTELRKQMHERKLPRWVPEYWESWGYFFSFIWGLCIAYTVLICVARPDGNRILAIFSVKPDEQSPLPRAYFLFLMGLALSSLMALWLAVPYIVLRQNNPFWNDHGRGDWKMAAVLALFGGVSAAVAFRALVREGNDRKTQVSIDASVLAYAGATAIVLAVYLFTLLSRLGHFRQPLAVFPTAMFAASLPSPVALAWNRITLAEKWKFSIRKSALIGLLLATIALLAALATPPVGPGSPSLYRLWHLFFGGVAVLGMIIAAQAMPLMEAIVKESRIAKTGDRSALISEVHLRLTAGFVLAGIAGFAFILWHLHSTVELSERFLAACRGLNLTSGVSPLTTLTFTMLALLAWSFLQLRRVCFHVDRRPEVPRLPDTDVFCPDLEKLVGDIDGRIEKEFFHPIYTLVLLASIVVCFLLSAFSDHQTLEGTSLNWLMLALAFLVSISLATVGARFGLIWLAFGEFLMHLERHPMREVFSYLPKGSVWAPLWQGGAKKRTHVSMTRSIECLMALEKNSKTPLRLARLVSEALPGLSGLTKTCLISSAERKRVPAEIYRITQQALRDVAEDVAAELEESKWPHGSYETRFEMSHEETLKEALRISQTEFKEAEPYAICSELLALRFVPYVNYVLLQLQNLALYLSIGFILLVLAMNSYAFRSRTVIDWFLVALFAVIGGLVITVFAQLDRDAIFSRVTRTEGGKLDRNFFFHMVSYGAIPTLALLASHVPSVAKFFFSWVKPAMDAIH